MSTLYMVCTLCGRKQTRGLLSHASWGLVEVSSGTPPRVCPTCREAHRDWEERARIAVMHVGDDATTTRFGATYR